jgi:hypothetical protein
VEGLEHLALHLRRGISQRLAEVGQASELLGEFFLLRLLPFGTDLLQRPLERRLVTPKLGDPRGDKLGLDSLLQRFPVWNVWPSCLDTGAIAAQNRAASDDWGSDGS